MRILVLSNMYPPHHLGGYELSCRDVVDRWRTAGHEISVLTTDHRVPGVSDPADEKGSGVRRELSFYWRSHVIVSPPLAERFRIERRNQQALKRALTEFRPDLVSIWHMGAMSLGLLTTIAEHGLPMILVVCDDWMLYGPDVDAWMRVFDRHPRAGRLIRSFFGLPTSLPTFKNAAFCFISDWTRIRAEQGSHLRMKIASVVYNGIDTRDFPITPRDDREWRWRLLYAGRIEERKGVHIAVDALARLPAETTLIIDGRGDPSYRERLEAIARGIGVQHQIQFQDTPRSKLRHQYADADAVVFPVVWDEPFGLVPVEAMACGTPVLATSTGGSREFLVEDANCIKVDPSDADSLARGIIRLSEDQALRNRLRRGGIATAEELSIDRFAEILDAWNRSALNSFDAVPDDRPSISGVLKAKGLA
jgi:glycogen synthase